MYLNYIIGAPCLIKPTDYTSYIINASKIFTQLAEKKNKVQNLQKKNCSYLFWSALGK